MANFKRGKCRRHGRITFTSEKTVLKRLGIELPIDRWKDNVPSWVKWPRYGRNPGKWNREFHSRPHRAATRRLARAVVRGADFDQIAWPVRGKPTVYFW